MKCKQLMLTMLLVVASGAAVAQRVADVRGAGSTGCEEFLEWSKENNLDTEYQTAAWVQGFLSGYNMFSTHKIVEIPDYSEILSQLTQFCSDNPQLHIGNATVFLLGELGGWKHPKLEK